MALMSASSPSARNDVLSALVRGFHFRWQTFLIIVLLNTGIAATYWIEDPRPFWHPFITVQACGLAIAYCINVALPWQSARPLLRLVIAVVVGSTLGHVLTILLKGYSPQYVLSNPRTFVLSYIAAILNGLFVSLFFLLKHREAHAAATLHRAEAERLRLSKYAVESELKLMQAQIEPHFLFNTLASVQYLTETDPSEASRLLGHLLAYLRAAMPKMRSASTTLGQETEFAAAYLNILRMRMGDRLDFRIDVPEQLRTHAFPPVLLISLVENAVTHGIEPQAAGGKITIEARTEDDRLLVCVTDTGSGLSGESRPGHGFGLTNVRERLVALYGTRGRFALADAEPHGARATIEIPLEAAPSEVAASASA
jgi:sensor histidine kinase YesM